MAPCSWSVPISKPSAREQGNAVTLPLPGGGQHGSPGLRPIPGAWTPKPLCCKLGYPPSARVPDGQAGSLLGPWAHLHANHGLRLARCLPRGCQAQLPLPGAGPSVHAGEGESPCPQAGGTCCPGALQPAGEAVQSGGQSGFPRGKGPGLGAKPAAKFIPPLPWESAEPPSPAPHSKGPFVPRAARTKADYPWGGREQLSPAGPRPASISSLIRGRGHWARGWAQVAGRSWGLFVSGPGWGGAAKAGSSTHPCLSPGGARTPRSLPCQALAPWAASCPPFHVAEV